MRLRVRSTPKPLIFRGRLTGRTLDFESGNKGSNPFPEAKFIEANAEDDYILEKYVASILAALVFLVCTVGLKADDTVLPVLKCRFKSGTVLLK